MRNTSASDNGKYPEFCYFASKRDDVFRSFKINPVYTEILEHTSPQQGADYLSIILNNKNLNLGADTWRTLLQNDSVGSPKVTTYKFSNNSITCSPTTLRYIKVLSDIINLFDIDQIKTVSEVGIGYAGQCRILLKMLKIHQYNLVDLPEVLALAERFLNVLDPQNGGGAVRYFDGTHLYNDIVSDLFISNYAFSELNRTVQDIYLEKVILKAKFGYITWNAPLIQSVFKLGGYSLDEFLKIIPNANIFPEQPLTAPGNCIVVWGNK